MRSHRLVAEQKQCRAIRIKLQLSLNDRCKSVYGASKVGISRYNVRSLIGRKIVQHNSCTRAISVSAEISVGREICKPFFSIWISEDVLLGDPKGTIVGTDATHFSRIFRK